MDTEISFYLPKFNISLLILRHFVMSVFATSVFYFERSKNIYVKIFARISYGILQYWVISPSTNCLGNKKESCSLTWLRECVGKSEYHRIQLHFLWSEYEMFQIPRRLPFTSPLHCILFFYTWSHVRTISCSLNQKIYSSESQWIFFFFIRYMNNFNINYTQFLLVKILDDCSMKYSGKYSQLILLLPTTADVVKNISLYIHDIACFWLALIFIS